MLHLTGFIYTSLIRFARVSYHVADFNTGNRILTVKQGYRHHKLSVKFVQISIDACFVVIPITVDNFAALFNCMPAGCAVDLMVAKRPSIKLAGAWRSVFGQAHQGSTVGFLLLHHFSVGLAVTVMILSFFGQICLGKQCKPRSDCSDQDLHCLPFRLHLLDSLLYGIPT